jgi:hypothetical protein
MIKYRVKNIHDYIESRIAYCRESKFNPEIGSQSIKVPQIFSQSLFKLWRNDYFIMVRCQPCTPPTKGTVSNDEVITLTHQPEVNVGIFVALIVVNQRNAVVG